MNRACFSYTAIAVCNAMLASTNMPTDRWEWFRFAVSVAVAGLTAHKAYFSVPPKAEPEQPNP